MKTSVAVLGRRGKMGREIENASASPAFRDRLSLVDETGSPTVWVEFSSPAGALDLCARIRASGVRTPLVVGSTGWTSDELLKLETYAAEFPILKASNFSFGIQLCRFALNLWQTFPDLDAWTVKIRELHHKEKKDSPSGTALSLREAIGRDVPITSIREGEIIGTHEVVFTSDSESLTLIHEAKRRSVFAEGALEAAIRLAAGKNFPKRLLTLDDLYLRREA